ncbi:hypothetical protein HPB50_018472 [Hyalomma asiaticum]|uniref:Uncharacterized protein n=1 Tax=Hyalomma asiaticum TaxID=266040 RepID=A0ACB7TML7_HYAAI|nr:hypothetical protein HPB50_018472 [Hyalomma asiaticum]
MKTGFINPRILRNKEKKKQMTKNARASVVARHRSLWNRPQRGPEAAKSPAKSVTQQRRPFHDRVAAGSTSECMDAAAPKPGAGSSTLGSTGLGSHGGDRAADAVLAKVSSHTV